MHTTRALATGLLVTLGLLTTGCQTSKYKDIQIETQTHPKVNFEGYTTYAWAAAAAGIRDPEGEWVAPDYDVASEIMYMTNRELREKGMREVVDAPDVLLMYAVGVDMRALNVVVDEEAGTETMEEIPKGALALLMADPESRQVMWVGTAEAELLEDVTTEERIERLDYAIRAMLKEAPF